MSTYQILTETQTIMGTTLVIGANTKPDRYAYKAIVSLRMHGENVIAFGEQNGNVSGVEIETNWNPKWKIDTVTLYVNPQRLEEFREKILALKPRRVIFNPGTEHPEFINELEENHIIAEVGCTLVMLSIGNY